MPLQKFNATFRIAEPTWANACVGDNGSPQIFDYAAGFATAANLLLDRVIASHAADVYADTLVYPICFNMRHATELFLKSAAMRLGQLATIRGTKLPDFDLAGSHDLGNIWKYVKQQAAAFDQRYEGLLARLEEYVADIAHIDATGQVFRYPFSTENHKHLVDVDVINLVVVKKRFSSLEALLHDLNGLNDWLIEEYGWKTFTTKLSRLQLVEIALALPARSNWGDPSFDEIKAKLRQKYGLSSRDYSKALNLIQSRHEMASLIGKTVPIPDLNVAVLCAFADIWSKRHDIEALRQPPQPHRSAEALLEEAHDFVEKWLRTTKVALSVRSCLQRPSRRKVLLRCAPCTTSRRSDSSPRCSSFCWVRIARRCRAIPNTPRSSKRTLVTF